MDNMMWPLISPLYSLHQLCCCSSSSAFDDMFLSQAQQRGKQELGRVDCSAFRVSLLMPRFSFTLHSPLQMISLQLVILLRFVFHL